MGVSGLRLEIMRKAFHMLSLVYWCAFIIWGWPKILTVMFGWFALVTVIEVARLRIPAVENFLVKAFDGMIRDTEREHFSGLIHTTAGCLVAMIIAQGHAIIIGISIGQLAFGDTAAALVGRLFGQTWLWGGRKSLEGSLAVLSTCYAIAMLAGVGSKAAIASALAVTVVESFPTTGYYNDNVWIPISSACVLKYFLGA